MNGIPTHDWSRVEAGIFHHFHHAWIDEIARAMNRGLLPPGYYALAEQIAGGLGPDVLTLQQPSNGAAPTAEPAGGIALATQSPQVLFRARAEPDLYAAKAKAVVIRHSSDHRVIAVVRIVSPGNQSTRHAMRSFIEMAAELLRASIHLLIVDLFAPGPRDPQGAHRLIWDEFIDNEFALPPSRPLTLAGYIGGPVPEAFVEPIALGAALPAMPLFLTSEVYVPVPLEETYQSAWEAVPAYWRGVLAGPTTQ